MERKMILQYYNEAIDIKIDGECCPSHRNPDLRFRFQFSEKNIRQVTYIMNQKIYFDLNYFFNSKNLDFRRENGMDNEKDPPSRSKFFDLGFLIITLFIYHDI